QSHEHQDRYNPGMSDSLRQMLANRLDENLQVSQRLEHEQHCKPRWEHNDHAAEHCGFEKGQKMFHRALLVVMIELTHSGCFPIRELRIEERNPNTKPLCDFFTILEHADIDWRILSQQRMQLGIVNHHRISREDRRFHRRMTGVRETPIQRNPNDRLDVQRNLIGCECVEESIKGLWQQEFELSQGDYHFINRRLA